MKQGLLIVGISYILSLVFMIKLWKNYFSISHRIIWTIILLVPIFGWFFFLAFSSPPDRWSDAMQQSTIRDD